MSSTPPFLDFEILQAGEAKVFALYQGINLTIIPDSGATATYSYVNNDKVTGHDIATQATISVKTTIPSDWPFIYVSAAGGPARVGLV